MADANNPDGTGGTGTDAQGGEEEPQSDADLIRQVEALYPWAVELGLLDLVVDLVRDDASSEEILAEIRGTAEWRAKFPNFYRDDGITLRFSGGEASYLNHIDELRGVMREFGMYNEAEDAPENYIGLLEYDIDPNEFRDRLVTYKSLENGTQYLRDAFYIYAGLDVSVDDMYRAVVDPGYKEQMVSTYEKESRENPPDYATWVDRMGDVALRDLQAGVNEAVDQGIIPPGAAADVIMIKKDVAKQYIDLLYTNGQMGGSGEPTAGAEPISFDALNRAFQYAMLASAASEQGLRLPDKARLQEFVQAGVSRANAVRAYGQYAQNKYGLAGMAERAGIQTIDQTMWEEATLLMQGRESALIDKAMDRERSLSRQGGGFSSRMEGSRVTQQR